MSENENIDYNGPADIVKGKIDPEQIGGWRVGDGDTTIPEIEPDEKSP